MRISVFFVLFVFTSFCSYGQNLVGYKGKEILKYMKENRNDMAYSEVTNESFRYLKYSNSTDSQTLLFFLNNDSTCMSERLICDLGVKAEKTKEFDSMYRKSGENRWIENRDGKDYLIEIKDEKWSCVITIEADK
jgi:hypothetical protein